MPSDVTITKIRDCLERNDRMGRYGHRFVKTKTGIRFELLPNNSVDQFILKSPEYPCLAECQRAMDELKYFIIHEKVSSIKSPNVRHEYDGNLSHGFRYRKPNGELLPYVSRTYWAKSSVNKAIVTIYSHIDEYVSYCKGTEEL